MSINKDFEDLLHHLNKEKAEYLVVGAYAVIFYTEPRYTKDIDLWIKNDLENAKKVYTALKKFGAPVENLKLEDLTNPQLVYQIGIEPNRIDILMGVGHANFEEVWKKKKESRYGKEKIFFPDVGDLIQAKKEAGRSKDQLDIEQLLKVKK